jgi:hypothetical protein
VGKERGVSLLHKLPEVPCDLEYIRLRTVEGDGGCWNWGGSAKGGRWPVIFFRRIDTEGVKRDFIVYVRHLVYWIKYGRRPRFSGGKTLGATCHNEKCVNPDHLKMTTFSEVQKRLLHTQTFVNRKRNAEARRAKSKLSDEAVQQIRSSEKPRKELAEEHGISVEYVRQLQLGQWRKDYRTSPFAGLGA